MNSEVTTAEINKPRAPAAPISKQSENVSRNAKRTRRREPCGPAVLRRPVDERKIATLEIIVYTAPGRPDSRSKFSPGLSMQPSQASTSLSWRNSLGVLWAGGTGLISCNLFNVAVGRCGAAEPRG